MFDALTLECFLAVAQSGSFTQAANKVGRTQSAVSQQVSKLEMQLDKVLFDRGRVSSLTPDGEIFLMYAKKIIQLNREALDRFTQPEYEGEVRFGVPEDFASVFLSDVLSEFVALHPRILLNIQCDLTLHLYERFRHQEFDLVLVKMNAPSDFPNGIDVWSETLDWVGDDVMFTQRRPIPLVLAPKPCVYRARAINTLNQHNVPWRVVFSSPSYASTIAAVTAGLGVSVLPRNMVPDDVAIITPPKQMKLEDTHISLLKHDSNPALDSFEAFVLAQLRPH